MIGCIGIVSAGAMGSAVGASLAGAGPRVVVALDGRSDRTVGRAAAAGLADVGSLDRLVAESELVVSIVPPAAALEVAAAIVEAIARNDRRPTVLDANAISPARAGEVARLVERAGARYVDGGIVGGPPRRGGRTDLVLSGPGADALASELTTDELVATVVGDEETAASALKMCHAAWTKGTSALLIAIRSLARHHGLDGALGELWGRSQPELWARSEHEGAVAGRAWRWVDEMAEIARTFEDAGLPGGAARAAGALYGRLSGFKDVAGDPPLDEVIAAVFTP